MSEDELIYYPIDMVDPDDPYGSRRFRMRLPKGAVLADSDLGRQDPPRSKHNRNYTYAYDPFTIWGAPRAHKECNGSDYTDRLEQFDRPKYHRLIEEIYKPEHCQIFSEHHCRGDLIEKFLRAYHDDESIKLLRVIEYCNWSTGYPTWRMDYVTTKVAK